MAFSVTNTFASAGTVSHSTLNENFDDVEDIINGGLTNENVASDAAIAVSKLGTNYQEVICPLTVRVADYAGWPAAGVTTPLAICSVPDGTWTMTEYTWVCNDTGDSLGKFSIVYGHYNGATWTTITTVAAGVTLSNAAGANDANDAAVSGLTTSLVPSSSVGHLALVSHTQGSGVMSAAGSFVHVACKLQRALQTA